VPAIEELSAAGWEPVPYAAACEDVIVERFGSAKQGELHFTLRNYTDKPVQTALRLDRRQLGIASDAPLVYLDILPGAPQLQEFSQQGCRLSLEAEGTRALWIGTRPQAAQHAFRRAAATLEKIERMFSSELRAHGQAALANALQNAREGSQATPQRALVLAQQLQQQALGLERALATRSPVDLAKLLFRLRAHISLAPAALLELGSEAPRAAASRTRGENAEVVWKLRAAASELTDLQARVVSPWPDMAGKYELAPLPARLARGKDLEIRAKLAIPSGAPRALLPYLLEVRGIAGTAPFNVATPVDVASGDSP
jgi:hypothetical protein